MFVEVTNLKGLLINLDSFDMSSDYKWKEIITKVGCVFLTDDDDRRTALNKICETELTFSEKNVSFLGNINLRTAIKKLGLQPYEIAYVTASVKELKAGLAEPIGTILIKSGLVEYEDAGYMSDFLLDDIPDILDIIRNTTGYFSEVQATLLDTGNYATSGYLFTFNLNVDGAECAVISGGRLFGPEHSKFPVHQLSHRIWRSKKDNSQDEIFFGIFGPMIEVVNDNFDKVDGITRVPPRPDDKRDRLLPIVVKLCSGGKYKNFCESLICRETYQKQKGLNKEERIQNVKGKFWASKDVKNKHIILIDDVLTTGSTVKECATMLLTAGASKVTIVVLAVNQFPSWRQPHDFPCPSENCDGKMLLRFRKDGQKAFFGCSNFFDKNCRENFNFRRGWKEYYRLNINNNEEEEDSSFQF